MTQNIQKVKSEESANFSGTKMNMQKQRRKLNEDGNLLDVQCINFYSFKSFPQISQNIINALWCTHTAPRYETMFFVL